MSRQRSLRIAARTGGIVALTLALVAAAVFVGSRLQTHAAGGVNNEAISVAKPGVAQHISASAKRSVNFSALPAAPAQSATAAAHAPHQHIPVSAAKYAQLKAQAPHNANAPLSRPTAANVSVAGIAGTILPNTPNPVGSGGMQSQGYYPSDMGLAVGDGYTIEMVNSNIAVYTINEGTHAISYSCGFKTLNAFFGVNAANSVGDPRAFYDPDTDRFFVLADDFGTFVYYLGESTTNNPCGTWTTQTVNVGSLESGSLADFPHFGFDSEAIYFTGDFFTSGGNGSFDNSFVAYCSKASLCSSGANAFYGLKDSANNPSFSVAPALSYGTPRVETLVNTDDAYTNQYTIWTISNPLGTATLSGINVGNSTNAVPPSAIDPSSNALDTGYVNVTGQPIWRNGSLYFSITSGLNNGTVATPHVVAGILWFQMGIGLNNGASGSRNDTIKNAYGRENGTILFSGTNFAFYPSQAVDPEGDICFTFNTASTTKYGSLTMTCRRPTTPRGLSSNAVDVLTGTGPYSPGTSPYRFGDYSATAFDNAGSPAFSPSCFVGAAMIENNQATTLWKTGFWQSCYTISDAS